MALAQKSVEQAAIVANVSQDNLGQVAALEWMERNGMLTEEGYLADAFVTLQTRVLSPNPVGQCTSRLSICEGLRASGWCEASRGARPSLADKIYNGAGPLEYFVLLKSFAELLLRYDEKFVFRHAQPKAYYEAILASFEGRGED